MKRPETLDLALVSLAMAALFSMTFPAWPREAAVAALAARIKAVGPEGAGNVDASAASREIAALGPQSLIELLREMDDASPPAANWLRGGVDAICERALRDGRSLPAAELEAFVLERSHPGPVRRLAFEWLVKADGTATGRLTPRMLDDPSVEMRRDAVARELEEVAHLLEKKEEADALAALKKLFAASRDLDQVEVIVKRLDALGEKVNLARHFGSIQEWRLIGPFDNIAKGGFDAKYPPEMEIDFHSEYEGKTSKVRWMEHSTADAYGLLDLNKAIGKHMGAVAYAFTRVRSAVEQPIHIRAGSPNAVKIWLNGKLLLSRDEYHHGSSMDQYKAPGTLKAGENAILIKVCQDEGKEEWQQDWSFQLRVCDPSGGGIW